MAANFEVDLTSYGVRPDSSEDITTALQQAFDDCRAHPGARLNLPPGRFRVHARSSASENELFRPIFTLDGYDGLSIDGHGTEIIATDTAPLFGLWNCRGISVRNLGIDYDPQPFSGGQVIAVNPDSFDLKVIAPNIARGGIKVEGSLEYDPVHGRLARQDVDYYQIGYPK